MSTMYITTNCIKIGCVQIWLNENTLVEEKICLKLLNLDEEF